jgi:ELWxxDGT repeat protein
VPELLGHRSIGLVKSHQVRVDRQHGIFTSDDGTNGVELAETDGTAAGFVMVKDIRPGPGSSPVNLVNVGGLLFFGNDGTTGLELWKATARSGTVLVKDINDDDYYRYFGDLAMSLARCSSRP